MQACVQEHSANDDSAEKLEYYSQNPSHEVRSWGLWLPRAAAGPPQRAMRTHHGSVRGAEACGNKKAYVTVNTSCGIGSIATLESMTTVARVSWWNTWQRNKGNSSKTYDAMLVSEAGDLYPAGRAIANGLAADTDCSTTTLDAEKCASQGAACTENSECGPSATCYCASTGCQPWP